MKRFLLAGLLIVGLSLGAAWIWWNQEHRGAGVLVLHGVVEKQEVRLGSKVGGRVAEVLIEEGMVVSPSTPLVRFLMPEVQAQHAQGAATLREAQAALEKAQNGPRPQELDEAMALLEAARAQEALVRAGPREEEIRQATADHEASQAEMNQARETFDRLTRLMGRNTASREEYDDARYAFDRAEERVKSAQARLDMMRAGSRAEEIQQAAAQRTAAQARYELLKAGTRPEEIDAAQAAVTQLEAKLAELQASLDEALVLAPPDGDCVIESIAVRAGDLVAPGAQVVRVLLARDLWVKLYVPETELGKLRLGQEVSLTIDSYPGRRFRGVVTQIAGEAEFTPRNVQSLEGRRSQVFGVKVRVDDPQGVFKSGMAAQVSIPLAAAEADR